MFMVLHIKKQPIPDDFSLILKFRVRIRRNRQETESKAKSAPIPVLSPKRIPFLCISRMRKCNTKAEKGELKVEFAFRLAIRLPSNCSPNGHRRARSSATSHSGVQEV